MAHTYLFLCPVITTFLWRLTSSFLCELLLFIPAKSAMEDIILQCDLLQELLMGSGAKTWSKLRKRFSSLIFLTCDSDQVGLFLKTWPIRSRSKSQMMSQASSGVNQSKLRGQNKTYSGKQSWKSKKKFSFSHFIPHNIATLDFHKWSRGLIDLLE